MVSHASAAVRRREMRSGGASGSLARADAARNVARSATWSEAKTKSYSSSVNGSVRAKKCEHVSIAVLIDSCVSAGARADASSDDVSHHDDKIAAVAAHAHRAATSKSAVAGIVSR